MSDNDTPVIQFYGKAGEGGYTITFYDNVSGSEDLPWASCELVGPFYGSTQLTAVDAAYNLRVSQQIVPGVRANGHKDTSKLASKVSSVRVTLAGTGS